MVTFYFLERIHSVPPDVLNQVIGTIQTAIAAVQDPNTPPTALAKMIFEPTTEDQNPQKDFKTTLEALANIQISEIDDPISLHRLKQKLECVIQQIKAKHLLLMGNNKRNLGEIDEPSLC